MAVKKNKPIKLEELTQEEKLKYEIAEELGLLDNCLLYTSPSPRDPG